MYKFLIVEDHPLFRKGLIQLLETREDFKVIGEISDAASTLDFLKKKVVDMALLDLSLKDSNGLDLLKDLHIRYPDLPVLVVSMHDEEYYAERVLNAGAKGYVMKQEASQRIMEAVEKILSGKIYVSQTVQERLLNRFSTNATSMADRIGRLSDREFQIFGYTGNGLGTKDIAGTLNLSVKTIETHKEHLKEKLNLESGKDLRKFAIEWKRSQ